jgi:hypothetical protein
VRPLPRTFLSLINTPIDGAEYLHIGPPYAPEDVCRLLNERRDVERNEDKTRTPKIVYEPSPVGCHTGQTKFLEEILPFLVVLS